MWYKTDLTETILTSETAGRMAGYVSPVYGRSYIGLWLFQVMGIPFDEILVITEHFFEEFFPETAVWSLPLWEQAYAVVGNDEESLEERRQRILLKRHKQPMNPCRMEKLAGMLAGAGIKITEFTGKNAFTVTLDRITDNMSGLQEFLDQVKPAHLTYEIRTVEHQQMDAVLDYRIAITEQETEMIII